MTLPFPILDLVQFSICLLIAYECFCRIVTTGPSTGALLRHSVVLRFGAFIALGFSPFVWGVHASWPSVIACLSIALSQLASSRSWLATISSHQKSPCLIGKRS